MEFLDEIGAMISSTIQLKKKMNGGKITREQLCEAVDAVLIMTPYKDDQEVRNKLIENAEFNNKTWMDSAHTMASEDRNWTAWLTKAKPDIQWLYWNRYEELLRKEGWPPKVIETLDETIDETLGQLTNPEQKGSWDRRGMVVGSVQSGKTANYTGLICKAADAGYKVIIVLAGFHKNLRSQTQIRIEEGFLGYDKSDPGNPKFIGVGEIAHDHKKLWPDAATTRADNGDFVAGATKNFANSIDRPLVFVVKKNKSVLENLIGYLKGQGRAQKGITDPTQYAPISEIPLLLIDDESDQGSINTNKSNIKDPRSEDNEEIDPEVDPTVINGLIRTILNTFEQSAYVAYTATPFANIMIHKDSDSKNFGEDLFPRSFITCIRPPTNYVGPQRMFGYTDAETGRETKGLPLTRKISDYADSMALNEKKGWMPPKHKSSHIPKFQGESKVPPSLYEALLSYLLSCSARLLRGQGSKHSSMLVHVTRFTDVQNKVTTQVKEALTSIRHCLVYGGDDPNFSAWQDLKHLWQEDYAKTTTSINEERCPAHEWREIEQVLPKVVQTVVVREINGSAGDVLDYERHRGTGLNVIAIGGDKLSRGLTLEGLLVSYFTRPSKTYDTLMQMGRWFGYRDGFVDLTRLFAPKELINWFRHISDADTELRNDFETMCAVGATPENFGHRVRTHPLLQVTSPVKMRDGQKEKCSYSGDLTQTIVFDAEKTTRDLNLVAVKTLLHEAEQKGKFDSSSSEHRPMWSEVPVKPVLNFLESYKTGSEDGIRRVDTNLLAKYISAQNSKGNLTDWTVLVSGISANDTQNTENLAGFNVGLRDRGDKAETPDYFRPGVITEPKDERVITLDEESFQKALDEKRKIEEQRNGSEAAAKIQYPGGPQLRKYRPSTKGLLIIYPIDPESHKYSNVDVPFMGFAISFPGIDSAQDIPVEYIVNSVGQQADGQ
jgi:hypothetical protein